MAEQENVALMRRWFQEVWNEGKLATVRELLSPQAVGMGLGDQPVCGPKDFVPFVEKLRGAFPDMRLTLEDVFGVGDKVVVRWSGTMTHTGGHLGMSASGKQVKTAGITIARIVGGQIVEGWDQWDRLTMMQMIGAVQMVGEKVVPAG